MCNYRDLPETRFQITQLRKDTITPLIAVISWNFDAQLMQDTILYHTAVIKGVIRHVLIN